MYELALEQFHRLAAYDRVNSRDLSYEESFQLTRFQKFLDKVGNPEKGLPVIHVTGSKGKGSTVALIGAALQMLGKRVGVFMSPYLRHPTESIFVNGEPLAPEIFSRFMSQYAPILNRLLPDEQITSFEVLTTIALQHFHDYDVDFAILETGLGGRLDATNVIESPVISVIGSIEKEHTDLLGNSMASIAYEKLGIVREETPVILAPQQDPFVTDFVRTFCREKQVPLLSVNSAYEPSVLSRSSESYAFRLQTPTRVIPSISLALLGDHQILNAMTAWAVLDQLMPDFPTEPVLEVWAQLGLPGRFEIRVDLTERNCILDGAHTPVSARMLRRTLDQLYGSHSLTFVLAFLNDKHVEAFLHELIRPGDAVVITQVNHPRALPARVVEQRLRQVFPNSDEVCVVITNNLRIAQQKAYKLKSNGPICFTGSFKLIEML